MRRFGSADGYSRVNLRLDLSFFLVYVGFGFGWDVRAELGASVVWIEFVVDFFADEFYVKSLI
jgi:hypothetical protein